MSEVKWIRIATDIFDNWKIRRIKAMPDGHRMVCMWFQLLCLCGKCNESGLIVLSGKIVANNELLATIWGEDLDVVQTALETFEELKMIEITTDGATRVSNWDEYQNTEGLDAIREYERTKKAKQRAKRKDGGASECVSQNAISGFMASQSNTSNLEYLLECGDYSLLEENHELLECVRAWMEYKDQKKPKAANHYDTERGMRSFLKKVLEGDSKYGTEAVINIIDESMANNYQGVTWDRLGKGPSTQQKGENVFDEWRNA